jgi:hypothetical protein
MFSPTIAISLIGIFACLGGVQWQLFLIHRRLIRTERRIIGGNVLLSNLPSGAHRSGYSIPAKIADEMERSSSSAHYR